MGGTPPFMSPKSKKLFLEGETLEFVKISELLEYVQLSDSFSLGLVLI